MDDDLNFDGRSPLCGYVSPPLDYGSPIFGGASQVINAVSDPEVSG